MKTCSEAGLVFNSAPGNPDRITIAFGSLTFVDVILGMQGFHIERYNDDGDSYLEYSRFPSWVVTRDERLSHAAKYIIWNAVEDPAEVANWEEIEPGLIRRLAWELLGDEVTV